MNGNSQTRPARRKALLAAMAVAALAGQLLITAPGAEAAGRDAVPQDKDKDKQKVVLHGLQEFTEDGTFTPPKGVTSVYVQAWGAGGGGGGGGGGSNVAPIFGGRGGGGGGGGFVWCVIDLDPKKPAVTVDLGEGGEGGPGGAAGTDGSAGTDATETTVTSSEDEGLLTAEGGKGGGGGFTSGGNGVPGAGGAGGECVKGGAVSRPSLDARLGFGGGVADGIVSPPLGRARGGDGGPGGAPGAPGVPGVNGGNGYLVFWW
ncbi:hypothetical protein [Streptomyces sp. NPDC002889]|uniref:glycine-rich domain-containing protein n=1 Tax=Streptomyces sp. NPDC002889 TaxID=3364669 RepID=UPI0036B2E1A1